jgi:hypothetical protein
MYEFGHSELRRREEMRGVLRRLEDALARHEDQLPPMPEVAADVPLVVLHQSVQLMRMEVDRLRSLLAEN